MGPGVEKYISKRAKLRILAGDVPEWMTTHIRGDYIIASTLSAPLWVSRDMFNELRREAIDKTRHTGMRWVLDHIIPVSHPYVCGLTVPWNMRVCPYHVNAAKGNKFHPDQHEFELVHPDPQQLTFTLEL